MENQLPIWYNNPNKLPIWYINGFRNWMSASYSIELDEKDVNAIHDFLESAKNVEIKKSLDTNKTFVLRNGEQHRFNQEGCDFIDSMRNYPAELRIRVMDISAAEMEKEIFEKRNFLSNKFKEMFNQTFLWKESGEPVNWQTIFKDGYYFEHKMSPTKIINQVAKGIITIESAEQLYNSLLDEIYLEEE